MIQLLPLPENTYFSYYCKRCKEPAQYGYLDGKDMKYLCARCAKKADK